MPRLVYIFSFLSVSILLMIGCTEEPTTVQNPPPPPFSGELKGVLRGDGILVPNNGYKNIVINLYKDATLVNSDTTDGLGNYSFFDLGPGNYELNSIADFGYENVAYAHEFVIISDSLVEKDIILDSLKYDYFPLKVGGRYTFYTRDIDGFFDGGGPQTYSNEYESNLTISIIDSQRIDGVIYLYFQGEQTYFNIIHEQGIPPDSFYILEGYFESRNSYVNCTIFGNGGVELRDYFKAVHIYDGYPITKEFLGIPHPSITPSVEFGVLVEINNQQYETLQYQFDDPAYSESHTKYNLSPILGLIYFDEFRAAGSLLISYYGIKIQLIDFVI